MTLNNQLAVLASSGLVSLAQVEPELEYLFRHVLVQDAAYNSLLKTDRQPLHRRVGEVLEKLHPDQLDALAPVLGQHFLEAGEVQRAAHYFAYAGDVALMTFANQEAEQQFRAGLELATEGEEYAHLLTGLGEALRRQSRVPEALRLWRQAIALYQQLGYVDDIAWLYARLARAVWENGDHLGSLAVCRQGLAALANAPDCVGKAALLHEAGRTSHLTGQEREAVGYCEQALAMARRCGSVEVEADALATLGQLLSGHEARRAFAQASELASFAGLYGVALRVYNNLAMLIAVEDGNLRASREHFRQAAAIAHLKASTAIEIVVTEGILWTSFWLSEFMVVEQDLTVLGRLILGDEMGELIAQIFQAGLLRCAGALNEAAQLLQAGRAISQERNYAERLVYIDNLLAGLMLELGQWEAVEPILLEAVDLGDRGLAWVWGRVGPCCQLSTVCARTGRMDEARRWLTQARSIAGRQPGPWEQEFLALAEGHLAAAEQRWAEAIVHFQTATKIQARMGKLWDRAQTLRQLAEAHLARGGPSDLRRAQEILREVRAEFETLNVPKYAALVRKRMAATM